MVTEVDHYEEVHETETENNRNLRPKQQMAQFLLCSVKVNITLHLKEIEKTLQCNAEQLFPLAFCPSTIELLLPLMERHTCEYCNGM